VEAKIVYFEQAGRRNTMETLRLALDEARLRGVEKVVLASTTGETARVAAEQFAGSGIGLIIIPHQYGFTEIQRFPPELVTELQQQGHRVHFGTMLFHTDGLYGSGSAEAMAIVLRTICQGMKVCVEMVMMAADAGLVARGEEIIAVAGTGRGADTAVVAVASTSNKLHELHVREILCKPYQNRSWRKGTTPYDHPQKDGSVDGRSGDEREW
jgi:hypothetical protein